MQVDLDYYTRILSLGGVLIHGGPAIFQTVSCWLRDKRLWLWENRDMKSQGAEL